MAKKADQPTILKTVRVEGGKTFAPGDEEELIEHGLTEEHITDLETQGILAYFHGKGRALADAKGSPRPPAEDDARGARRGALADRGASDKTPSAIAAPKRAAPTGEVNPRAAS